MKLHSLDDLFKNRLFRVPDYQRGYAWGESQVIDFWQDLQRLHTGRLHYTGVITLEPVEAALWQRNNPDEWLIPGFKPFYVVDGQQRLTTAVVLIQAVLETVEAKKIGPDKLPEEQWIANIRKKYSLHVAPDGQQKTYIFGYEKDNPSNEFFKTKILGHYSDQNSYARTLYTGNLEKAKTIFKERLQALSPEDIFCLFEKLTLNFRFNLYEISEEIDVFVTFETMNNRGKGLTHLELLKNRLIYLTTLLPDNNVHKPMRNMINNVWKTLYSYLGKNAENPLDEDDFLKNHWIMYYTYSRKRGDDYINYLLNEVFTAQNVIEPWSEEARITDRKICDYVQSLQVSVRYWFYMHNPYFESTPENNDEDNKRLLQRFLHLTFKSFRPLILAALQTYPITEVNSLLMKAERCIFILFYLNYNRSNTGDSDFYAMARRLLRQENTIEEINAAIDHWVTDYYRPKNFLNYIENQYEYNNKEGFYHWNGLSYFLYEYEQWLNQRGKQPPLKLSWSVLKARARGGETIEHIYPQTPDDEEWHLTFAAMSDEQRNFLTHSLGNLVPLSRPKNASLSNDSFHHKINNGNGVGYYNGSAAENEIAQIAHWDATAILDRGLALLDFLEQRWAITLGDRAFKVALLHLRFVDPQTDDTPDVTESLTPMSD